MNITQLLKKMNDKNETSIRKVIFNEVSFLIAMAGFISSVIFWVVNPQTELATRVSALESDNAHNTQYYKAAEDNQTAILNEVKQRLTEVEKHQLDILQSLARLIK